MIDKIGLMAAMLGSAMAGVQAEGVFIWIGSATFLLVFANQLREWKNKGRVSMAGAVEFSKTARVATHEELRALESVVDRNRTEILTELHLLRTDLKQWSTNAYQSRKQMHRDIHEHANALAFLAGRLTSMGDVEGAERVRRMVDRTDAGEG